MIANNDNLSNQEHKGMMNETVIFKKADLQNALGEIKGLMAKVDEASKDKSSDKLPEYKDKLQNIIDSVEKQDGDKNTQEDYISADSSDVKESIVISSKAIQAFEEAIDHLNTENHQGHENDAYYNIEKELTSLINHIESSSLNPDPKGMKNSLER